MTKYSPSIAAGTSSKAAIPVVPPKYGELAHTAAEGVLLCDGAKSIIYANSGATRVTGFSAEELTGRTMASLYPARDRARNIRNCSDTLRRVGTWSATLALQRKGQGVIRCELRIMYHRFPGSEDQLLMVLFRPVSDDTPSTLSKPTCLWEQIVESLDDALLVVDRLGTITACNDGYLRLISRTRDEIVGARMPYPWLAASSVERYADALKNIRRGGKVLNTIIGWRGDDTKPVITSMTVTKLRQGASKTEAYIVALRDVSNVAYIDQLRRADDRLQLLMAELQRRTATLHTLVEIQRLVLEDAPIERILREIISGVQKLVRYDLGGIYLVDPDGKTMRSHALSRHDRFSKMVGMFPLPVGQGLVGSAALTGERAIVNDAHMDPRSVYPEGKRPQVEHVIVIPLRMKEFVYGVLAVARNSASKFFEDDAEVLQSFADAAMVALESAGIISAGPSGNRAKLPRIRVHSSGLRILSKSTHDGDTGSGRRHAPKR